MEEKRLQYFLETKIIELKGAQPYLHAQIAFCYSAFACVSANWGAASIPSLKGKTAVVTGGNSGIGFEAALQLAKHGAHVILACRNASKAEEAAARIRSEAGDDGGEVETMTLDVSSQQSVKAFATDFAKAHDKLHLLINNAGVMAVPLGLTVDGHERQFATNHLGHFALTAYLFESLKKAAPDARVVNVSSHAHRGAAKVPCDQTSRRNHVFARVHQRSMGGDQEDDEELCWMSSSQLDARSCVVMPRTSQSFIYHYNQHSVGNQIAPS